MTKISSLKQLVNKKRAFLGILLLIILSLTSAWLIYVNNSNNSFGKKLLDDVAVRKCVRLQDMSNKCFEMTGRVYVFNGDLENVIESAREYIIENNLDDKDRTYSQLFTKSTNEIMDIISKDTDTGKEREPKEKALMLSLLMSGGLFGEYNFPHSVEKDKAIYIAFNFDAGPDSEYILRSEMELNNEQAAQLAKISNNLSENEYLLIIAKR